MRFCLLLLLLRCAGGGGGGDAAALEDIKMWRGWRAHLCCLVGFRRPFIFSRRFGIPIFFGFVCLLHGRLNDDDVECDADQGLKIIRIDESEEVEDDALSNRSEGFWSDDGSMASIFLISPNFGRVRRV